MKTPAVIASLTIVGSVAFAAGQRTPPGMPQSTQSTSARSQSVAEVPHHADGLPEAVRSQSFRGFPCEAEPLPWLTVAHDAPGIDFCRFRPLPARSADVNADGREEAFAIEDGAISLVDQGQPTSADVACIWYCQLSYEPTGVTSALRPILDSSLIRSRAAASGLLSGWYRVLTSVYGWQDMDGDADLDCVVWISGYNEDYSTFYERFFWFENTGFQHSARNVADLNDDGTVDGFDLSQLLAAWGPTS
jgi:hypothetical protein